MGRSFHAAGGEVLFRATTLGIKCLQCSIVDARFSSLPGSGVISERLSIERTWLDRTRRGLFLRGLGPSRQTVDGRSVDAVVEPAQPVEVYSETNAGQE
jgi:hypothetical protein